MTFWYCTFDYFYLTITLRSFRRYLKKLTSIHPRLPRLFKASEITLSDRGSSDSRFRSREVSRNFRLASKYSICLWRKIGPWWSVPSVTPAGARSLGKSLSFVQRARYTTDNNHRVCNESRIEEGWRWWWAASWRGWRTETRRFIACG